MTFAMVVAMRPKSIQGEGTQRFVKTLREEVVSRFTGESPLAGDLYARIIWFCRQQNPADVDNIIKPILDALRGVIYADDRAIVKCSAERVDTAVTVDLSDADMPPGLFQELDTLLAEGHDHILYVEVGPMPSRRVAFGPIDGGAR